MIFSEDNWLAHYGILRKSGRYPYGSGGPQYASNKSFLGYVAQLKSEGLSETEIAEGMGITTTQLRAAKSIAKNEERASNMAMAQRLRDKGYSNVAIGERMGINESSVRSLLAPGAKDKNDVLTATSDMLKREVGDKGYIDIGSGVETHLNVSKTKLGNAVAMLKEEGYKVHYVKVPQLGTGKETTIKVLSKPDVPYSEVFKNRYDIQPPGVHSEDGGRSYNSLKPPLSLDSSRLAIRYAEDGGTDADGVMYVRPGVDDISLGGSRYAQVRVAVDGSHYLKGMAMYRDDLPDGVDIVFNTNKKRADIGDNKLAALKPMKTIAKDDPTIDMSNPFGSAIKPGGQTLDPSGTRAISVMNRVNEEGDWSAWRKALSSQVLSKQAPGLAKQQLEMTYERSKQELDEIMALTNPTVKRKLLEAYSDSVDSSAVHLKAAALPRQGSHVILPVNSMKESEIYAPNYRNGERVALIRYPHGGKFEIPELTVNNNQAEAKRLLGRAPDAVGINHKVAERLSGADFDGDTVLVIPNGSNKIASRPALEGLKGFDPQAAYPAYEGMPKMKPRTKQIEMGKVSNLITDMTIRGAKSDELAAAVRHSMVVIDAEKHNLNYKESERANGIAALKKKYQSDPNDPSAKGASTLISRATSEIRVNDRRLARVNEGGPVDKATGRLVYKDTGKMVTNKKGEVVLKTIKSVKLAETPDARTLSSGTTIEKVYADHSNRLKALANQARREAVHTKNIPYSPSAKKAYAKEVKELNDGLSLALRNAPLERRAQLIANATVSAKKRAYPDMDPADLKKVKSQALLEARNRTGAGKTRINLTEKHWAAIQAGAVSPSKLDSILTNSDLEKVKALATPRTKLAMTSAKTARAQSMAAAGYTQAEIADALGVSLTTLKEGIK